MNRQPVTGTNQQSKSETPLVSGILQRAAVRAVSENEVRSTEKVESGTFRQSRFQHDFSRVPIHTDTSPLVQRKLTIGALGDKYEQEADAIASKVITMPESAVQREMAPEEEQKDEEVPVQAKAATEGKLHSSGDLENHLNASKGGGSNLPHEVRTFMEPRFGADFSSVRVHTDSTAVQMNRDLGSQAFTHGSDIYFGAGKSVGNNELTAHELTHVVQQTGGGQRHHQSLIQRYTEKNVGGVPMRVSEDNSIATDNRQILYALPARVTAANAALSKVGQHGSFINLTQDSADKVKINKRELQRVYPSWVVKSTPTGHSGANAANQPGGTDSEGNTGAIMAIWTDCGRSSRAVMGTDTAQRAVYKDMSGKKKTTNAAFNPGNWTGDIYSQLMPEFMKIPAYQKYLKKGIHYDTPGVYKTPTDATDAKRMYWKLGPKGRLAFDARAGINHAANPAIGGGYTMATEYDMPGSAEIPGKPRWNFHWAGVIMKGGTDNVTLENYAVTEPYAKSKGVDQYDFIDRNWNFAMYGTVKKSQTFHQEHLDTGTHGTRGTSFAVRSDTV